MDEIFTVCQDGFEGVAEHDTLSVTFCECKRIIKQQCFHMNIRGRLTIPARLPLVVHVLQAVFCSIIKRNCLSKLFASSCEMSKYAI